MVKIRLSIDGYRLRLGHEAVVRQPAVHHFYLACCVALGDQPLIAVLIQGGGTLPCCVGDGFTNPPGKRVVHIVRMAAVRQVDARQSVDAVVQVLGGLAVADALAQVAVGVVAVVGAGEVEQFTGGALVGVGAAVAAEAVADLVVGVGFGRQPGMAGVGEAVHGVVLVIVAARFRVDFADGVDAAPAVLAVELGALAGVGDLDALDAGVGVPGELGFAAAATPVSRHRCQVLQSSISSHFIARLTVE